MRAKTWGSLILAMGLMSGCGKKIEDRKQPAIGPATDKAAAPAESTAAAPDKTAIDTAARDSLQRVDTANGTD